MKPAVFSLTFLLLIAACSSPAPSLPPAPASIVEDSSVTLAVPQSATLYGTLELPARAFPVPVALIIAGSGPTDRNGNSRILPGANNSLRYLARGLAERGIASLRYDKRGIAASSKAMSKESDLRFDDFVGDAKAWIAKLRSDPRFSTVTVVGHSEGSLIGMLAARDASADGFVSLEGAGRNAKDVIVAQLAPQVPAAVLDNVKEMMRKVEAGEKVEGVPPMLAPLFRPSVQPYLASWFKYTPSAEIAKLAIPSLVVQGTTDIQTSAEDARLLAEGHANVRLLTIEGMNHVLKAAPAGAANQAAAYSDPALPVVPQLLDEVAAYIKSATRK